ncbi:hypothetical protein LCGC14_1215380 [marine sediment metagenome]|uniref:Uncharacterized protein n=1 Tax=marine sediment metagenome TaxID=412755 RepID=A0A0F9PHF3_9ZZZZ
MDKMAVEGLVSAELLGAEAANPPYVTPHQGYAVILEELDELWDEVKVKRENRSIDRMRREAVQVAATAMRFAIDLT